jgi:hypothetical protein
MKNSPIFFLRVLVLFLLVLVLSCKRPVPDPDPSGNLRNAMAAFLKKSADTAKVRFDVKEVTYFKDANFYECEFKVRMILPDKDTTGSMTARISSDFSNVTRKW